MKSLQARVNEIGNRLNQIDDAQRPFPGTIIFTCDADGSKRYLIKHGNKLRWVDEDNLKEFLEPYREQDKMIIFKPEKVKEYD